MTKGFRWKDMWCNDKHSYREKMTIKIEKQNVFIIVLFAIYMLLLIGVIIFKLPFYSPKLSDGIRVINLIPFQGSFDENGVIVWREIAQNILIFVPLGIYISMLKSNWPFIKKVLPIIGLSFVFETTQFIFAMGRSDITDLIGNTFGGLIGISVYALLFKVFKRRAVTVVNTLALTVTVCAVAYFTYLFYLSHFVMMKLPPL